MFLIILQIVQRRDQDTRPYVSGQEAVWHTSVLFTGTANSLYSIPHISLTTGLISIKFTYFIPSTYATYIPTLEGISQVVYEICVHKYCPFSSHYSSFSSSLHRFTKVTLSQRMTPFSWIDFFQISHTYKVLCGLLQSEIWRCLN